ncbi:MAG: ferritin [Desulfovibrio sp.]|jgi:ferritin|nr:ferritin [Desulfovibrio sp.]
MSKVLAALNDQVIREFYSAYLYLAMTTYFADAGLPGFANWMRVQAKEEVTHANKMYDYLLSRGHKVVLGAIDAPPASWKSALDVMKAGLAHEQKVTGYINDLASLAVKEKDHATQIFLNWFVTEQVEEEQNFTDLVNALSLIKGEGQGLLMLDRELAGRTFTDATATADAG